MRDISPDPVDHGRTTQAYADESVPDPEKTPELVVVAAAVLAFVVCLANFALGEVGVGVAAVIVGLLAFGADLAWLAVTSLMAEANSFASLTQPQILLCGASPDAARRTRPIPKGTLPVGNDSLRHCAAEVPIPPTAEAAGPLGTG